MARLRHPRFNVQRVHPIAPVSRVEVQIREEEASPEEEIELLRLVQHRDWHIVVAGLSDPRYNVVIAIHPDPLTTRYFEAYVSSEAVS